MINLIVSNRPWCKNMAYNLNLITNYNFKLVKNEHQLIQATSLNKKINKIFFPHWSLKVSPNLYNKFECIMFHVTDLPYGRGGSPLQNLIIRGHKNSKLTAFKCTAEMDAGPVYCKRKISLNGTAQSIFENISILSEKMIIQILSKNLKPKPQVGKIVEFKRRKPYQSNIENCNSYKEIYDHIRMLDADGYPSAFLKLNKFIISFNSAKLKKNEVIAKVKIKLEGD